MNTVEDRIDGARVLVTEKPATISTLLFAKVVKYFGTGIVTVLKGLKNMKNKSGLSMEEFLNSDVDFSMFVDALNDISTKLEPETFLLLIQEIISGTRVQHPTNASELMEVSNSNFDAVFTGRMMLMYKVLFLNLKVNFGDFLAGGVSGIAQSVPVMPTVDKNGK